MAEIIKFPGKWHGKQESEPAGDLSADFFGESPSLEVIDLLQKRHKMTLVLTGVTSLIKNMTGRELAGFEKNKSDLYQVVGQYDDEEIIQWLLMSDNVAWSAKPAFYSVLIDEFMRRGLSSEFKLNP